MRFAFSALLFVFYSAALLLAFQGSAFGQKMSRDEKVRLDKKLVEAKGFWIYNDLEHAYALAKETGKPIVVALRCIPCEECVKLDDELVDTDPVIRPLLEKFICVRIVGANGLDLDLFQYDTDQSFAVFMLNADKTIYGRFGTRSHHTQWSDDVSLAGLARALETALTLHAEYPANKNVLMDKRGKPLEFSSPEKYPALKDKFASQLDYSGDVVKSCIHCHQIGDARRDFYWSQSQPIPEQLLFPYPHPNSIGLVLDPTQCATVKRIVESTAAAQANILPGDQITQINNQPMLSIADVQWVLHHVSASGGSIDLTVRRDNKGFQTAIHLADGWRRADDTSWRVASWEQRRIATGGMQLSPLTSEERKKLDLDSPMAMRVKHVGQYGLHAAAKKAGFFKDDVLVRFDGRDDLIRESDLFAFVNENHKAGETVEVQVLRDEKILNLQLPIQR